MNEKNVLFEEWCIVEMLGHRKVAGRVSERMIAGKGFLQVDVPARDGSFQTQWIAPESIYCLTPTGEQLCRKIAEECGPQPISKWDLRQLLEKPQERQLTFHEHYDEVDGGKNDYDE